MLSGTDQQRDRTMPPEQKKTNLRLALILASVALVFFAGFMAKMIFLGR
jgi:hypothetical protein